MGRPVERLAKVSKEEFNGYVRSRKLCGLSEDKDEGRFEYWQKIEHKHFEIGAVRTKRAYYVLKVIQSRA